MSLAKTRQPAKAIAGAGRQAGKHDDGGRVVGPLGLAADQAFGPESHDPARHFGRGRPLTDQVLRIEQETGLELVAQAAGERSR